MSRVTRAGWRDSRPDKREGLRSHRRLGAVSEVPESEGGLVELIDTTPLRRRVSVYCQESSRQEGQSQEESESDWSDRHHFGGREATFIKLLKNRK